MKRIFLIFFILSGFTNLFFAESIFTDNGFYIETNAFYNFEYGTLNEYVIDTDLDDEKFKLSELNWPVYNHNIGSNLDFGWKWLSLNTSFSLGFPCTYGSMTDSDWMDITDHSKKTNYSISESTQNTTHFFSFGISGNIPCTPKSVYSFLYASLHPFIQYNYKYYSFSACNAEGWYGDNNSPMVSYDDDSATHYEKGELCPIDYEREHTNIFLGIKADFLLLNRFSLSAGSKWGIYTSVHSIDTHYSRMNKSNGYMYYDSMEGNWQTFSFYAAFELKLAKGFILGTSYNYFYQGFLEGKTFSKDLHLTTYSMSDSTSGSSGSTQSFSIYIKYSLKEPFFIY